MASSRARHACSHSRHARLLREARIGALRAGVGAVVEDLDRGGFTPALRAVSYTSVAGPIERRTMSAKLSRRGFLGVAGGATAGTALLGASKPAGAQSELTSQEQPNILDVPGARLYYEVRGEGPLLVMVPGKGGTVNSAAPVVGELSGHYQVVAYHRRGYSLSRLVGAQDYRHRLATDADDVRRLIEHLGAEPATVFGSSSGAIVALELLTRRPDVVGTVVAHEPPAVRLLSDGERWVDFFDDVYDTYRRSGVDPALEQFAAGTGIPQGGPPPPPDPTVCSFDAANNVYWFERELRQYPRVRLDVDRLAAHADQLMLAGGRESTQDVAYQPNTVLAERLDKPIVNLPGGHLGFITHPTEFARELLAALGR
jgi:pimeloyl-ACP methyl ester carboxylesterase